MFSDVRPVPGWFRKAKHVLAVDTLDGSNRASVRVAGSTRTVTLDPDRAGPELVS